MRKDLAVAATFAKAARSFPLLKSSSRPVLPSLRAQLRPCTEKYVTLDNFSGTCSIIIYIIYTAKNPMQKPTTGSPLVFVFCFCVLCFVFVFVFNIILT